MNPGEKNRYCITPRVFLHYLGIHFLDIKGINYQYKRLKEEASLATRIALIGSECVYITAASYMESKFCREIVQPYKMLFNFGHIQAVGGGANIEEFIWNKHQQYQSNKLQKIAYKRFCINSLPPFVTKKNSATSDIITNWRAILEHGNVPSLFESTRYKVHSDIENRWSLVPEKICTKAFIVDNVAEHIFDDKNNLHEENCLHNVINQLYFESFTHELNAGVISELVWLEPSHEIQTYAPCLPYKKIIQLSREIGFLKEIVSVEPVDIISLRESPLWEAIVSEIKDGATNAQVKMEYYMVRRDTHPSNAKDISIAIFVALDEEFREFVDIIPNELQHHKNTILGGHDHYFEINSNAGKHTGCIIRLIGDMGPDKVTHAAGQTIEKWKPKLVIMLGIAASLSDDLELGDVVIAKQVDAYASNLKATADESKDDSFNLSHRGSVYRAPHAEIEAIKDFEFVSNNLFIQWQDESVRDASRIFGELNQTNKKEANSPSVYRVNLASGPVMGASKAFAKWLHTRDQSIKALEMEAAGLALASHDRVKPIPHIIIRGISDYGDEGKSQLEDHSKGLYRRLAMRNATRYLLKLIISDTIPVRDSEDE